MRRNKLIHLYLPSGNLNGAVGAITVIQQKDADHYEVIANIPIKPGRQERGASARTKQVLCQSFDERPTRGPNSRV